jgi:hypothetical protein
MIGCIAGPASQTQIAAAAAWTASRTAGWTPRRSSSSDTAITPANGPSHGLGPGNQSVAANHPAQIASPPPRGMACACSERALGRSRGKRSARRSRTSSTAQATAAAMIADTPVIAVVRRETHSRGLQLAAASCCLRPLLPAYTVGYRRGEYRRNYTRRGASVTRGQKRCVVAIKQHASKRVLGSRVLACQWIRRFGTMASTSRLLLRRFRWQAQRSCLLAYFFR